MARSFSQELEDLLNPLPKFADPEDDGDEATKARVIERFSEDDEDDAVCESAGQKRTSSQLLDTDRRYEGKPVSRKQLLQDTDESDDDDDDNEEEDNAEEGDYDSSVNDVEADELEEDESIEDEGADEDDEGQEEEFLDSDPKLGGALISEGSDGSSSKRVDFLKLTAGMDDLGVSEDEDDDDDDDDNEDDDDDSRLESEGSDGAEGSEEDGGNEDAVQTFSQDKVDKEVEKGKAVKNQLSLWDQLLEGRIKIQKALMTANQLPQPLTFQEFKKRGGAEFAEALKNPHKALKALQRSLWELHDQLLHQNPDTKAIAVGEQQDESSDEKDEEPRSVQGAAAPKRKLDLALYPDLMAKRFAAFEPYCDATLQKWDDRTRLSVGRSSRGFGAFERNVVTQVKQVLMDNERLVRRTQTRRSEYRTLGKTEASAVPPQNILTDAEAAEHFKTNAHLKDLDEDIFDDDDFYHLLLRELIEHRTSAADPSDQVAMGKQWLAIQKLRSRIKRKVDTKASKGRKVRFHVHSKLINFMAPIDYSQMNDETRSKLYRGLFGQNPSVTC